MHKGEEETNNVEARFLVASWWNENVVDPNNDIMKGGRMLRIVS